MTGALLGTPRYMSPEQAAASTSKLDHRTDIYSLGATLYELATSQPVFAADTPHEVILQILSDDPLPLRRHRSELPRDLETIVLKCLSKDPQQRYDSAADLSDDLRAYLDGRSIRARQAGPVERAVRWVKRRQRSMATTAGVVAATIFLAAALLLGWRSHES
jgi:serine/threonine protein kinase